MNEFFLDPRVWPGAAILFALLLLARIFRSRLFSVIILIALPLHVVFFRDIPPGMPQGEDLVISPASGKVVMIDSVKEDRFLKEESWRIRIFLAVWNVHVTRSPMEGKIVYQEHVLGKHANALFIDASQYNESNWIGIKNNDRRVLIRQMTGAIARRIYSDVSEGMHVDQGQKLGIICYGSSVELFIPKHSFKPTVTAGCRVKVGESVLGTWTGGEAS